MGPGTISSPRGCDLETNDRAVTPRTSTSPSLNEHVSFDVSVVLVGLWLSPAAAQTSAPNNMLTAAGFVVKYPDTPEKQEIFTP